MGKINLSKFDDISELLSCEYSIHGAIEKLAGENENYLITDPDMNKFVFKLADELTSSEMITIEHLAVEAVLKQNLKISLPEIIPANSNKIEAFFKTSSNEILRGRLLKFVDGKAWCDSLPEDKLQLRDLGRIIASINNAMNEIKHPAGDRTHHWDLANAQLHRKNIHFIENKTKRRLLEWFFHLFGANAKPFLSSLPHSLIHGDINDDNVLVSGDKVCGLLDFGDCLNNPTICDLAIALAYHTLDEKKPLQAAAAIIEAYHEVRPLLVEELEVLFPLMCARLAVSVLISSQRRKEDPERDGWFVSEERAWKKLEEFYKISPVDAADILAGTTGLNPFAGRGMSVSEITKKRQTLIAPSLSSSYPEPIKMIKGSGQYLYDNNGRPYLDLYNNVCHVGHCHPKVVKAGQEQMALLNTNTRYLYDNLTEYAQKLCSTMPKELDTCFFVNSGSEANELALRIARAHTNRKDMLVVNGAYHGHTSTMINISPYKFMGKGGTGKPEPWVHVVPLADGYRGEYKGYDETIGKKYGDDVAQIISKLNIPIAGFITESLLSCGGQVIPPKGYFKTVFEHVRNSGGLCIADEVQVGFGRVGTHFWAFEMQDVVPDIVVLGKPIGNGHPMSAVITRKEIAQSFANGMEFFATFGGNPVSCAIGMAVLEVIKEENLQAHAQEMGDHMLEGLEKLKDKYPLIGDVRGQGLFIGIEFVKSRSTLEPATHEASELVNRLKNKGILLGTDGPFNNVIKIKPPMVLSKDDINYFLHILKEELDASCY